MSQQEPLPYRVAGPALAHCVATSASLLAQRRLRLPRHNLGLRISFADQTFARVYRETVVLDRDPIEPCSLVVGFRLRLVRGRAHSVFRAESLLNTPLFVGFPGFVSKLWLSHDQHDLYRGIYDWDGYERAEHYARSLWRVLEVASVPGSIRYQVVPGVRRDDLVQLHAKHSETTGEPPWWQPVGVG